MNSKNSSALPGLSLIRTICAFSILFGHFIQKGGWGMAELTPIWLPQIYLPVVTFFVISGFLMAWGLLREEEKTGDVSIVHTYKRRAVRIVPLYYIGIALGFLTLWLCGRTPDGNLWGLLLLQPNVTHILGTTPFPLWHYWFLGTIITFYIIFPLLFKFCRKHRLIVFIGIAAAWLLVKWGSYFILGKGFVYRYLGVMQMDNLLLGAIVAILFYQQRPWLVKVCGSLAFAIGSWLLFLSTQIWVPMLPSLVCSTVIAIISVMVILSCFCGHPVLENRVTQFFSRISYGIYIFHPIVIYVCAEEMKRFGIAGEGTGGGLISLFAVLFATIGLAWLMNRFVEQPIAKWK